MNINRARKEGGTNYPAYLLASSAILYLVLCSTTITVLFSCILSNALSKQLPLMRRGEETFQRFPRTLCREEWHLTQLTE